MFIESLRKFLVQDKYNTDHEIEIYRYVIEPKEKPIGVIFGKFSPWTKNGHGKLVTEAQKIFGKDNVIIVSPTRNKKDPKVDIFTNEQKEQIIKRSNPNINFYRIESDIPIRMFTRIVDLGYSRPVLVIGQDREKEFGKFFIPYNSSNKGIDDPKHLDFGKGECYIVSRTNEDVSATKVRECLLNGDMQKFIELTGYSEDIWQLIIEMLKKNNVVENVGKNFSEYFYLLEGGNVKMGGNLLSADKIPIDKLTEEQFNQLKDEIIETIQTINSTFYKEYDEPLWPEIDNNIKNHKIFSGSTRLLFSKEFNEFKQHKQTVGDIDLQIPEEKMNKLKEFLPKYINEPFGTMIYLGQGGRSPIQVNTLFKTKNFPNLFKNVQIDFEPTEWKNNEPTEFSTFGHYSSWEDMKSNIKGVFVKYLMRALVGREKLKDAVIMTSTGKISKSVKFNDPGMKKFSVDKGVRTGFSPVLDDKGHIKIVDGKKVYKEIPTKDSTYQRDLKDIFKSAFDHEPENDKEIKEFYSFKGALKLMKKYLDKDQIKDVFDKFLELLWGENAQEIEQGKFDDDKINISDFKIKKAAYDVFVETFIELKLNEKELKKYMSPFYFKLFNKKMK